MTGEHGGRRRREGPRGLDRVRPPDPSRPQRPDPQGKRALYSVDPEANPTPVVLVRCSRCGVERGLTLSEVPGLLRPPFVLTPFCRTMWGRCPTCEDRGWLRLSRGPGIPWPLLAAR